MKDPGRYCPSCGTTAPGAFCTSCGTAVGARPCPQCAAPVVPGARFCGACGGAMAPGPGGRGLGNERSSPQRGPSAIPLPWVVAGVAGVVTLVLLFVLVRRPAIPPAAASLGSAATAEGSPPALSTLTPLQQFDRLFERVMRAAEQGDTTTVVSFLPMALQAYQQLGVAAADARYHAGLLQLRAGNVDATLALADTILVDAPAHLFALALRVAVEEARGGARGASSALEAFGAAYAKEMVSPRPEYAGHQTLLDQMRDRVATAPSGR